MRAKRYFLILFSLVSIFAFTIYAQFVFALTPPCGKEGDKYLCNNPLNAGDLSNLIKSVVTQIQPFAITIVSFLIIIYGFRYVLAARSGSEQKLIKLHQELSWLLLGAAIVGGAAVIIKAIFDFAKELN